MTNVIEDELKMQGEELPVPPALPRPPQQIPSKFLDSQNNVDTNRLWRSYQALERKLGAGERIVPERPEDYCIECGDRSVDPFVNAALHQAGFSNEQAQLVYDLALKYVIPELERRDKDIKAERIRGRLEEHFGGPERWGEVARQLDAWGHAHLPTDVIETMAGSFEGVLALHRMMSSDEPGVGTRERSAPDVLDEAELRRLMDDPKYWRDHEPALMTKVRDGFRKLYPD